MYTHHTRIYPKRDDVYRAEFPGPYYSTSSVYSYSPTSASDCPEHGRSRKKITVILTTSIILATLGVLSIAGVAAYLGILSKNISNNASQSAVEESYLLSESKGRINPGGGYFTTTEENEYIFTTNDDVGGLDALDGVPGDSLVDLTNSLSETSRSSSTPANKYNRRTTSTSPPTRTIEGHYGNGNRNDNNRNALMNNNDNIISPNMVTAPPPHEEDTGVRFFTEEANASPKPFTKVPPRHNRNRQRFPFTNSHSLDPSTTTMLSTTESEEDAKPNDKDAGGNNKASNDNNKGNEDNLVKQNSTVVHLSHPENAKTADLRPESMNGGGGVGGNTNNSSKMNNREGLPYSIHRSSVVYVDSSMDSNGGGTASTTSTTLNKPNKDDLERTDSTSQITRQDVSKPISKLSDKNPDAEMTSANNDNERKDTGMTSFNKNSDEDVSRADEPPSDGSDNSNRRHDHDQVHSMDEIVINGERDDEDKFRPHNPPLNEHMLKPIHPIISSEQEDSSGHLKNHKLPISFDRISPEYYDTQPWTPLLDRPNLDKRPRVDIDNPHLSSTEPVIVWNSEEPEEESQSLEMPPHAPNDQILTNYSVDPTGLDVMYGYGGNFTVGTYYGYGHSGPSSESTTGQNPKGNRPGMIMDEPISYHNPNIPVPNPNRGNVSSNQTTQQSSPSEQFMNGFKPSNMPAYTILIPHIPNPPLTDKPKVSLNNGTQLRENDDLLSPLLSPPEDYANTYKMDRMGEIEEDATNGPHDDSIVEKYHNPTANYNTPVRKDNKKHESNKITYNFEAIKTIPVPEDEDEMKDDDYMDADVDEFTESAQGEPKIYRLDPDSVVDFVPDTLGGMNNRPSIPPSSSTSTTVRTSTLRKEEDPEGEGVTEDGTGDDEDSVEEEEEEKEHEDIQNKTRMHSNRTKNFDKEFSPESMELLIGPKEPDVLIKSTTDLIMSTLGSLNLIKAPIQEPSEEEIEDKLRNSDILPVQDEPFPGDGNSSSPLFPPVRSYVGINQPLRPKPNRADSMSTNKQFKFSDDRLDVLPSFPPDVATTASLQKVIAMMLGGDGNNDKSRQLANHPLIKGFLNKQNVTLVVANETGTSQVISLESIMPTVMPTQRQTPTTEQIASTSPTPSVTSGHREQKSFSSGHRDSKIDHAQFTTSGDDVEHVPVPLIMTESPIKSDLPSAPLHLTAFPWSSRPPKSSSKIHNNSPVYKFVLKKGQSVEDLLKEIFLNYTDIEPHREGTYRDTSLEMQQIPVKLGMIANNPAGFKSLEDVNFEQTTTAGTVIPPVRISHHVETDPDIHPGMPMFPSSQEEDASREVQTSTSVVVNENMDEMDLGCGTNETFKCVSSGKCIPMYLRCNFIRECEDNSDEEGCLCADFLRANGNARKLCDGIPDCADASDEYQNCDYCKPEQYICAGTRSCINKDQLCNSHRDCQYGDDESDCVKIGDNEIDTLKEDFSPTYHRQGHLMVRKTGNWGKLCVESFSSVVSHWEVKDLARAVCKALTFSDYDKVEKIKDPTPNNTEPYYELHYGSVNQTASSGEAHQRPGLGFRQTECKSKLVVNVTCQDLQCGVAPRAYTQRARYRVTRIVGGANSLPGKWPWQAALYKNGEYQCGATLISSRWLLSAGHCFYHAQDDHWVARLGTLRRGATVLSPYEQVVRITHIFLHPEYKDVGFINDVSLLRLEKEVNFTDFVRPVCLPGKESRIRDGRMCTVVGWGQLFEVGRVFPDTLQEVQLPLISTGECRKRTLFLPLYKLTDQMFCAGFDRGGRDACLGDSGGPLMCPENDGRWSLYGVTSNGYGCARANRPGVYTKVTSYLDWIYEKMSQDSAFTYRDKSKPCPGHRCLLGECLDKRQVCNGIRDCIEDDGSDERGPNCTTNAYHR